MRHPLNVLLVAAEAAGTQVLRAVTAAGFAVTGLLTGERHGDEPRLGNGVRTAADHLGCPVWPARSVRDPAFAKRIKRDRVDVLLNVHSLFVIRKEILAAPRIGSFNMHPGPLPECAGLNAVSWALYEGQSTHAGTIHWMVPEIDAGAIAYQARFDIEEQDTALTMSVKSVKAGVPLIERLLAAAATSPAAIPAGAQDLTRRRYHGREVPQDGSLVWSRPARDVVNFVRACDYLPWVSPWGHPKSVFREREVVVLKAARTGMPSDALPGSVGSVAERGVLVSAADEWVLVRRVLCDGRSMEARELLDSGGRFDETEGGAGGGGGSGGGGGGRVENAPMTRADTVRRSLAHVSRVALVLCVAGLGCELDEAVLGDLAARVVVAPNRITLRTDQVADFLAVGFTATGDTATIDVTWSATGGAVIGTSDVGSLHYAQFRAGTQAGTFAVVATGHPGEDSDTALVSVTTVGVASVTVAPATASVPAGSAVQLTATPKDAAGDALAGRVVTWTSNAPTIATVSTTGRVTGMTVGSATITATSEGVSGTAAVTVTAAVLATYYVAPTGNDANPGTEVAPFKTIEKAASLVNPGDVVIVEDGVYTDHNGDGAVFKITRGGTAGARVTFKARNKWGAKLDGQNGTTANGIDFDNGIGYVRVEGFDIYGVANRGSPTTGRGSASGIDLYDGGHTSEIVGNHIHNVGQVCTLSTNTNGQVAIFLQQPNVTVEQNLIHDIGRFFPGENGCSYTGFTGYQTLDHGMYLNGGSPGADGALIRNNVFYNTRHGWAVQMYPGSLSNVSVLNNTFAFGNPNKNYTHIVLDASISGSTIANNIFYNPEGGKTIEAGGFSGTITISNNITMGTAMTDRSSIPAGMLLVNNQLMTDPLFVSALGVPVDFHLLAGSPAIDAGLSLTLVTIDFDGLVRPRGAGHDIGAYEF